MIVETRPVRRETASLRSPPEDLQQWGKCRSVESGKAKVVLWEISQLGSSASANKITPEQSRATLHFAPRPRRMILIVCKKIRQIESREIFLM